jgi:hypothetical protein
MTIEHSANTNHYGGQLAFGAGSLLYISVGDGGGANDPQNRAQSVESRLGKVLRIDPRKSGSRPFTVPADNPFVNRPGWDGIFSYGLRNPHRFSFDRANGDLVIGDVGQDRADEIDFVNASQGGGKGRNFGWRCYEGFERTPGVPTCDPPNHTPPVHERVHQPGCNSLTGGYVVRDPELESLQGRYVYGDYCTGELRSTILGTPRAQDDRPLGVSFPAFNLSSFGEDGRGRIHLTALNEGKVYRLAD